MICGKQIFKSKTDGAKHLSGVNGDNRPSRKGDKNRLSVVYYCNDCNGWHVSSKSEKRKKGVNAPSGNADFTKPVKPLHRGFFVIKNFSSKPL